MTDRIDVATVRWFAGFSECTRRKYGAFIIDKDGFTISRGANKRVGRCCNGTCVRDTLNIKHGRNTDAGAEIHAEQAALILTDINHVQYPLSIYVAGLDSKGEPLNAFENSPCYSCARMIAFADIEDVYLPVDNQWERFNIYDIMETWEQSWRNFK